MAKGGATNLDNLVLLCRHHHRLVHEGGYQLERARDGSIAVFTPLRRRIGAVPRNRGVYWFCEPPPRKPPSDEPPRPDGPGP